MIVGQRANYNIDLAIAAASKYLYDRKGLRKIVTLFSGADIGDVSSSGRYGD